MLTLTAIDQANLDGGQWALAYLLTLQPEPPMAELSRPTGLGVGDLDNFTPLADPHLLTAATAKIKDVSALNEVRKKAKGKGKDKKGEAEKTE